MHHSLTRPQPISAIEDVYALLDDAALMRLVGVGNHDAFAVVVNNHTRRLLSLAKRTLLNTADAEDVVQTVFIKLWQKPQSWDADKSALSTWLYRVVLNACYDISRRRQSAGVAIDYDSTAAASIQSPDVLELIDAAEQDRHRRKIMLNALSNLPDSQRDAISLAVFAEMPQKQVADTLGVSVKAVESLLSRAKTKLKAGVGQAHTKHGDA